MMPPLPKDDAIQFNNGLSAAQNLGIQALLKSKTIVRAASLAGVTKQAMHDWLNDANFCREYRKVRKKAYDIASAGLVRLTSPAITELRRALKTGTIDQRITAATVILKNVIGVNAIADLEGDVEELREQLAKQNAYTRELEERLQEYEGSGRHATGGFNPGRTRPSLDSIRPIPADEDGGSES